MFDSSFGDKLSLHARHVLKEAQDIARYTKTGEIEPRHLLFALTLENGGLGSIILDHLGFKKESIGKYCLKKTPISGEEGEKKDPPTLSLTLQNLLTRSYFLAKAHGYPYVGTEHLVASLLESDNDDLVRVMNDLRITKEQIREVLDSHLRFERFPELARMFEFSEFTTSEQTTTRNRDERTVLELYTVNLGEQAAQHGSYFLGRERELERLSHILGRKEKNNAILVGDPGVGKTALVTALAIKMREGKSGPFLSGKSIHSLDLALLVAGTSFRGEFENRVKELLAEIKEHPEIILFIDEVHTLIGTGNTQGGLDAANILKPALARGDIQVIGATTFSEYKRHFEKDAALERRFQMIVLAEPTPKEAIDILKHVRSPYESFHQLHITDDALEAAVRLSTRYLPDRFLPDKALDLIDEAASAERQRIHQEQEKTTHQPTAFKLKQQEITLHQEKEELLARGEYDAAQHIASSVQQIGQTLNSAKTPSSPSIHKATVNEQHILRIISHITGIPFRELSESQPKDELKRLKIALETRVVGQTEAKRLLSQTLTRSLSGIHDPQRPLGSFLFLGPTGVGKTHLARVIAEEFFGDAQALIRLDMSEFMERHSVAKIIGAPAGYVGYGEGGKLTEAIRRKPYAVVLFDEIEKAHPDIFNILLQILDEGVLTDAEGRRVSFKNTLIILTSNIGTASFTRSAKVGFASSLPKAKLRAEFETIKQEVLDELNRELRPELIARLDHTIVFEALNEAALLDITRLELKRLKERLSAQSITLSYPQSLITRIARESFDPNHGARLVRRNVENSVALLLAEKLLSHRKPKRLSLTLRHDRISVR